MALTPQQFKAFIYQGGVDDAVATQRGIDYANSMGLTSQQATKLFNDALGTNFSPSDYEAVASNAAATQITPQEFKNLIYAGGATDAVATQRGVDYLKNMGYTPTEATKIFNDALGTNFTVGDYNRVAGPVSGNAFRDYIYEGTGGNDTLATVRGINYAKSLGLNPQQTVDLFNTSLGTNFTTADLTRASGEVSNLSAGATQGAGLLTGNDFKNYIYQGTGGNDTQATVRGILYADSLGLTPQQTVNLFNTSLGTNFTTADLARARSEVQSVAPVAAPVVPATPATTTPGTRPTTPTTPGTQPTTTTLPTTVQPAFGTNTFAQNFANYQAIPIGAQYNPAVTPGGVSPYSAIMQQMGGGTFQNPYANFVPNTPLGGYNPNLYSDLAVLNKEAADKAKSLINTQTDYGGTGAGDAGGGNDGGGGDGGDGGGGDGGGDGGGGASGDCVDPDVHILLADRSTVRAGDLKVGDMLHTLHDETFIYGDYPVEYVNILQRPKVEALFDDGQKIIVSITHKFLTADNKWEKISDLEIGTSIRGFGDVTKKLVSITDVGTGPVIEMVVTDAHTYISEGLVSHNKFYGGLITSVSGHDPAGPDEGQVNMMRGEYVIKKSSVKKYGRGLLDMINEGKVPAKKIRSLLD